MTDWSRRASLPRGRKGLCSVIKGVAARGYRRKQREKQKREREREQTDRQKGRGGRGQECCATFRPRAKTRWGTD